jgi:fructosamine-3-kinase
MISANKHLLTAVENRLSLHYKNSIHISLVNLVYGRDINTCFHIKSNVGDFFLKTNRHPPHPSLFQKEYNGLEILRNTHAIVVPAPILYYAEEDTYFLITEFISKGKPVNRFWEKFATGMAKLHHFTQDQYGLFEDNFIGSITQSNHMESRWSDFYIKERLTPLILLAAKHKLIDRAGEKKFENFLQKIPSILPEEKPSLLHGDLWAGNFCANAMGLPCIYDPAIYYGHREMDLAMAKLFGGFDLKFFEYYEHYFPLGKSWNKRIPVYQLYYLLVHLILFGGSYYHQVIDIIDLYQ